MHGGSHAVFSPVALAERAELERIAWAHLRGGFCRRCMTLAHALGHVGRRPLLAGSADRRSHGAPFLAAVSRDDRYSRLPLTRRETELVQRLCRGESTKEAAFSMGVAPKTAYTYRQRAMDKFEAGTFIGLLRAAVRTGIISAEEVLHVNDKLKERR